MSVDPETRRRALALIPPKPALHPVPWPDLEVRRLNVLHVTLVAYFVAYQCVNVASHSGKLGLDPVAGIAFALLVPMALLVVATAVVVGRLLRRARIRAAVARAGRDAPEVDWSSDRTHARSSYFERSVPKFALIGMMPLCFVALGLAISRASRVSVPFEASLGLVATVFTSFFAWVAFRGGVQVRFDRFPYLLGERATFFVATTAGSPRLEHARYLLRCIRPGGLDLASGRGSRPHDTLWEDCLDAPPEQWPGPDEYVKVTFDIPPGLPTTALHGDPRTRWELLVLGRNRWGTLLETIVVPVYAAPGAGSAGA